jgi:hypothetical protein
MSDFSTMADLQDALSAPTPAAHRDAWLGD